MECERKAAIFELEKLRVPFFDLDFGDDLQLQRFKVMIFTDKASFKQAGGKGQIQLKCDGHLFDDVDINVSIGSCANSMTSVGPFQHNFTKRAIWRSSTCSCPQ